MQKKTEENTTKILNRKLLSEKSEEEEEFKLFKCVLIKEF
jgi:hypothetical protein